MTSQAISSEIIKKLDLLGLNEQNKVLKYIKSLINSKRDGKSGLLKLAGSLSKEDAEEMIKAIEDGCENIDYNEW